ncbi:hypothetical protein BDV06DRAFT_227260 [Aspergillus oleicola]
MDHIELQHQAIVEHVLQGSLFLAVLAFPTQRLLEQGTGTGIWAIQPAHLPPNLGSRSATMRRTGPGCFKVNEFIRISAVADDGTTPPIEDEEARQWTYRQKFYSAMITAKLTHNAAQRINAFMISRVHALLKAVKENFKPEGTGTYVKLQQRYMSLTREKCGSAQALGAGIRKIHAAKLLLDPDCVTSEIERTFFFMHALGPEYESFRDHIFRQMDLVNESDANGNLTKAAPTFDYIENKAIEEEHRKGQLSKQPTKA